MRFEQGDSGSRLGHISAHAGVQTALAWRGGDWRPPALNVPGNPQVPPRLETQPSATSLVPLCGVWLCQPRGHRWWSEYPRPWTAGEVKRLRGPLGPPGSRLGYGAEWSLRRSYGRATAWLCWVARQLLPKT